MARSLITIVLATLGVFAGPSAADTLSIRIPLEDGRLEVRDVLESLCRAAGVEPGDRFDDLPGSISVKTTLGRVQVKVFDRLVPDAIRTQIEPDAVVIHVDREALAAQADEMIEGIERWLAESSTTSADLREKSHVYLCELASGRIASASMAARPSPGDDTAEFGLLYCERDSSMKRCSACREECGASSTMDWLRSASTHEAQLGYRGCALAQQ